MNRQKFSKSLQGREGLEEAVGSSIVGKLYSLGKIPKDLIWKAGGFVKRNALVVVRQIDKSRPDYHCCESCLKAYMMKESRKYDKDFEMRIAKALKCKAGHEGYFMDAGRLVKI